MITSKVNQKKPSKFLLSALLFGNLLEYFDFFIFAHFAFLLAPQFYPSINPLQDAIVWGLFFAIGFLARPFGGYFFGNLADQKGRKHSLTMSVLGIAIPTFIIGILPTYQQIGIFAPLLLICCRIVQGGCMGGEFTNGAVLLMESFGWKKAGTISGIYNGAAGSGSLLALLTVSICTQSYMPSWSWRVPFILASFLGLFTYFLRQYITESPVFKNLNEVKLERIQPISNLMHRLYFLKAFTVGGIAGTFIWIPLSYTSYYLTKIIKMPLNQAIKYTILAALTHNIITALMGYISDRTGWYQMLKASCIFQLLVIFPAFTLLGLGKIAIFQILLIIPAGMAYAVVHPLCAFDVPPLLRGRVSGFAFSAGLSVFAGLTPLITATITQLMHVSFWGVGAYVGVIALAGYIALTIIAKMLKNISARVNGMQNINHHSAENIANYNGNYQSPGTILNGLEEQEALYENYKPIKKFQ